MKHPVIAAIVTAACFAAALPASGAEAARDMYTRALAQERAIRDEANKPTLAQMRHVVASYELVVRRHPSSGYCDNALWQAGNVALLAFQRFGEEADRKTAARLFALLVKGYPSSKLAAGAREALATPPPPVAERGQSPPPGSDLDFRRLTNSPPATESRKSRSDPGGGSLTTLKDIHRTALPDGVRVTIDLDGEVAYHQEEIDNPRRLFFDLKSVKAGPNLQDVALKFDDDVVREVRLGRHPQNTTRLVVDLQGIADYTVYPLYGPYRLVIDLRRAGAAPTPTPSLAPAPVVLPPVTLPPPRMPERKPAETKTSAGDQTPLPSKPALSKSLSPIAPAANANGTFSLSRQLGLSISRIVIDAGHGGHDPGARGNGIDEAELTLDVALRLQKLLQQQPGTEVVMTRDTDEFVPLQERTAIANREGADLFLSIHANASRNAQARGIETYFLNFATNPEAEAVAARENAASGQAMHSLPDIVKAIALNNKINESRDFAQTVQRSMVKRLGTRGRTIRDLGVKQAPFVVLIGASMPSVLAEISFVTNKQEGALLKTQNYRQQIAQALFEAVAAYQRGLKQMNAVAGKKATF